MPGIDVMDAVGSNIRLDVRQRQVMRILPRINEDVNEEWISDKTRHHVDALVRNRLDRPWVREKGKLQRGELAGGARDFRQAAEEGRKQGRGDRRRPARRRDDVCGEEAARRAGVEACSKGGRPGSTYDTTSLSAVAFNSTIAGIENADAVLLVGSNIRWEAPLIATRVRKVARKGGKVFAIGPEVDLGMKVEWLGDDLKLLGKLPKRSRRTRSRKRERPAVIVGAGALAAGGARRGAGAGRAARPHPGRLERLQRRSTPPRRAWRR